MWYILYRKMWYTTKRHGIALYLKGNIKKIACQLKYIPNTCIHYFSCYSFVQTKTKALPVLINVPWGRTRLPWENRGPSEGPLYIAMSSLYIYRTVYEHRRQVLELF
jgi:hypothetical protein